MICCIDGNEATRNMTVYTLQLAKLSARGAANADEFWEGFRKEVPELILLDTELPGADSLELLQKIRKAPRGSDIPVVMVANSSTEYETIRYLDSGADDFWTRPFGMMEMVSRIRAILRRHHPKGVARQIRIGTLLLDLNEYLVTIDGQRVNLTYKEFELLKLFLSNPGVVFTREELMRQIWNTNHTGESRTVDIHIRTLRQKLGSYARIIETVRNVGYRLENRKPESVPAK